MCKVNYVKSMCEIVTHVFLVHLHAAQVYFAGWVLQPQQK